MKFSIVSVLAFVAAAIAQETTADFDPVSVPLEWKEYNAGDALPITWQVKEHYKSKKISITLIGGATQNTQVPLLTVATNVDNGAGSYTWTIGKELGAEAVYGFILRDEDASTGIFQYSFPFKIVKGEKADVTVTSAGGVKTIDVSDAADVPVVTETAVLTTTVPCTTLVNTPGPIHTPVPNNQTTFATQPATQPVELPSTVPATVPSETPVAPPAQVTGAATRMGASMALVAGVVAAAFAL